MFITWLLSVMMKPSQQSITQSRIRPSYRRKRESMGKSTPSFGCSPRRRTQAAGGSLTMSLGNTGFRIASIKRVVYMKSHSTQPNSTRSILVHTQFPFLHREGTPLGTGFWRMGSTGSRQTSVKNFLQYVTLFGPQNYPAWPCRSANNWSMTKRTAFIRLWATYFSPPVSAAFPSTN